MPARTVKGPVFTLIFQGQTIVVKHIPAKGKRCRVFAPDGVQIESGLVTLETRKSSDGEEDSANASNRNLSKER